MNKNNLPNGSPQPSPERSDAQVPKDITRRQFLVAMAVASVLGVTAEEVIRNGWVSMGHNEHDDDHAEVSPDVLERLIENALALRDIQQTSVTTHLTAQQKREAILVPKPANSKKFVCIDERCKEEGTGEGLAGVGVLMSDAELRAKAIEEVDEAEEAFNNGETEFTYVICPHGNGKCGAAKLARTNSGQQDMSNAAIDATALEGGRRFEQFLRAEILRRPALAGRTIKFDVHMVPEEHFLQASHHPGAIAMHHAHPDKTMNLDRRTGALMYNVKNVRDGILAAKIALGRHGMLHGPTNVQLPAHLQYRIILTGTPQTVTQLNAEYQRELAKPENADIRTNVSITVWNM